MTELPVNSEIKVFRPTWQEFQDFTSYVEYMESQGAQHGGIVKVIPPKEWIPRKEGYSDLAALGIIIRSSLRQVSIGKNGLYQQVNVSRKALTVEQFCILANSKQYVTPKHWDYDDLERRFWKNIKYVAAIYGSDVDGSIIDKEQTVWNLTKLGTILDWIEEDYGMEIYGVNTVYLYFGMWKTIFPWHTEDMDLYSINYLHFGEPKTWYAIPPQFGRKFEEVASAHFKLSYANCNAFLRHKTTVIYPPLIRKHGIPIIQEKGEIIITFPYAYHMGFNHGFNCAEATNFALPRWIEYGKRSSQCKCNNKFVKIPMDSFIKKFQPYKYEQWLKGNDIGYHPEDLSKQTLANFPIQLHDNIVEKKNFCKMNPDIDINEIILNPNVPDSVKAILKGNFQEHVSSDESENEEKIDINALEKIKTAKQILQYLDKSDRVKSTKKKKNLARPRKRRAEIVHDKQNLRIAKPQNRELLQKLNAHLTKHLEKSKNNENVSPNILNDQPTCSYWKRNK